MTNDTEYHIQVRGKNAGGEGPHAETNGTPLAPPAKPTNVTVTPGNWKLTLSWTPAVGAASHELRYGNFIHDSPPIFLWRDWETTGNDGHTLTGLTNGISYHVQVRGKNATGTGPHVEVNGTPIAAPAAPTGLAVNLGNGQVEVSWTAAARATSHEIRHGTSSGDGDWAATTTNTSHTLTGLTNGTTYYIQVRGKNTAGDGSHAETTGTPLTKPTNLTTTVSDGQIAVSWTAAVGATSHEFRYGTTSGAGTWAATTNDTSQTITGLTNDTEYFVQVRGKNTTGAGAHAEISATPIAAPARPMDLMVEGLNNNKQLSVSWTAAVGATSHEFRYGTTSGAGTWAATTSDTSQTITGLTNGTTYYVQVRGKNTIGAGAHAEISATPNTAPAAPTSLTRASGDSSITVGWTAAARATSHEFRYGTTSGAGTWAATDTNTSQTITGLTNGTKYFVQIRGKNIGGYGPDEQISARPNPAIPTNLMANIGNKRVDVSWTPAKGAVSHEIRYGTTSGAGTWAETDTESSHAITGLTNATTYYIQVRGKHYNGTGAHAEITATPNTPPDAPTNLTATAGNGQLEMSWTAGARATSHEIRHGTTSGAGTWVATSGDTSHTITGLANGTLYYVQVRGKNDTGTGTHVETTATPIGTPEAPMNLMAIAGNGQLGISWTAAVGATSHEFRYGTTSGAGTWAATTSDTSHTITGLTNGTAYYVQVRGKNTIGAGTHAEISATPAIPKPANVVAQPLKAGQLSVTWTAAWGADKHQVRYGTSSGSGTWADSANAIYKITGVTNGTMYYVGVRAIHGTHEGEVIETTATPIGKVTGVSVDAGDTELTVSWTDATGATASEFRYGISDSLPSEWEEVTSPYEITGLTNGTQYTVQLRGKNASGPSKDVATVAATPVAPPSSAPDTPTDLTATASGNKQLRVTWTAAVGAASHEYRYGTSSGAGTWAETPLPTVVVLNELTNGTLYYIQVRGKNAVGEGEHVEVTGTPWALPSTPGNVRAQPAESKAIKVSWTLDLQGGASYEIRYSETEDEGTWEDVGRVRNHTIRGLTDGTTYYVEVRSVNPRGKSAPGKDNAIPIGFIDTMAIEPGHQKLTATWTTNAPGSTKTEGQYSMTVGKNFPGPIDEDNWVEVTSPYEITGLTNGTWYTVYLRGKNDSGVGADITSLTEKPEADAPTDLAVTAGNEQLAVTLDGGTTSHEP